MSQVETKAVLVVDDESILAETIAEFLEDYGFRCEVATSSNEAIHILNLQKFDLILSDIKMPGLDGVYLLKEIRKIYPDIPPKVFMMSGFTDWNTNQLLELGAQAFFSKPLDLKSLEKSLKTI